MTDACWSENKEVKRSKDPLAAVDTVDVGLGYGQAVDTRQQLFVLFLCRFMHIHHSLQGDRQLAYLDVLTEGLTERKRQNLSFLTAAREGCA